MKMGKKKKIILPLMMAGMRRDPECMVAIKEIKVSYTQKQSSFSIHLTQPPTVDQLLLNNGQYKPKKG